jgi:hypothetical protein
MLTAWIATEWVLSYLWIPPESVPEILQQEFSCCFRAIPSSYELFASSHHRAEEPEWLMYRPN